MKMRMFLIGFSCFVCLFLGFSSLARADVTLTQGGDEAVFFLAYTDSLDPEPLILDISQLSGRAGTSLLEKNEKGLSVVMLDSPLASCQELLDRVCQKDCPRITYIFKEKQGTFFFPGGPSIGSPRPYRIILKVTYRKIGINPDRKTEGMQGADENAGNSDDALIEWDGNIYTQRDFRGEGILSKEIDLDVGVHRLEKKNNSFLDVDWAILEPSEARQSGPRPGPEIVFKRINAAKYQVKVRGAREPFWLVFSTAFDNHWQLFEASPADQKMPAPGEWITEYPDLKISEAARAASFIPSDAAYLFKKPKDIPHYRVNGYANGWFIDPRETDLGEDFTLVIYFRTQSVLYAGLMITCLVLLGTAGILCFVNLKSFLAKNDSEQNR